MKGESEHLGRVVVTPVVTRVSGSQGDVGLHGQAPFFIGEAKPQLGLDTGLLCIPSESINSRLVGNWFQLLSQPI